jgi:predicted nucleic acid-binding protein
MRKCILDTNVLVALVDPQDAHNSDASEIVEQLNQDVLLPVIVLAEFLSGQVDATATFQKLQKKWRDITYSTEEELGIMTEFPQKTRKKLKANDCLILAQCITQDANLITFDANLKKAYEEL